MLPKIRRQAAIKLRHLRAEAREEFVAEVVARAYCGLAPASRAGPPRNRPPDSLGEIRRPPSPCRTASRLPAKQCQDILVSAGQPDRWTLRSSGSTAAILKTEFGTSCSSKTAERARPKSRWLGWTSRRGCARCRSEIAALHGLWRWGRRPAAVARQFGLSAGRVSQLRHWFFAQWEQFQCDRKPVGGVN